MAVTESKKAQSIQAQMTTQAGSPPVESPPVQTTHGTVQFWDVNTDAAIQACSDVAALSKALTGGGSSGGGSSVEAVGAAGAAAIAGGVSAAAGVASALFAGGNFGLGISNAVDAGTSTGSMQLTIANYSSSPLVMYNCNPSNIDIADMPNPIASGSSDTLVLTSSSAIGTSSAFTVFFMVGTGASSIPFQLQYSYTDQGNPGRWILSGAADGSPEHTYPTKLQMYGLSFTGNAKYPSFSVYTSNTETGSGALSIAVYSMAPG